MIKNGGKRVIMLLGCCSSALRPLAGPDLLLKVFPVRCCQPAAPPAAAAVACARVDLVASGASRLVSERFMNTETGRRFVRIPLFS